MPFFDEDTFKRLDKRKALPGKTPPIEFISSGIYALDYATGGGFPRQRVTEISGRNQSAKTTTVLVCAGRVIHHGGYVALLETESALDYKWMEILGIPRNEIYTGEEQGEMEDYHFHVWHPPYLESALETLITLYRTNKYDLIILDSFGGSPVRAAAEGSMDDVIMMKKARVGSAFKEKMMAIAYDGNAAVVITNQVYTNSNQPYYDKLKPEGGYVVSSGGESMPYLSAIRIYMETPGKLEIKKGNVTELVGKEMRGMVFKNKTGRPVPQKFKFDIRIDDPDNPYINFPQDIIDTSVLCGLLDKRGRYWFYKEENIAGSETEMMEKLINDNLFSTQLEQELWEIIGRHEN